MAINISTRNYRFLVNSKDYTLGLIESTNWATNSIDQTGFVKTTASFTLADVRDLPGSLDDRLNSDWNIGQSVRIQTADSIGSFRPHPCGALRILSSSWDFEQRKLQVNCGCLISLLSFKSPTNPNKLNLEQAKLTNRTAIALSLLQQAGITAISGLDSLPYPLYYPFDLSGSYLECAGKLLYSCLRFGRIDANEVFRVEPATLDNPVSMQWQIGGDSGDELWYRRLSSAESPREIIEVRGSRQVGEIPQYPIKSFSERYGDPQVIDPNLLGSGIALFEQQTITENYTKETGTLERITRKLEPIGLVIPNTSSVFKTSLIDSYFEVTTYQYETNEEGKLKRINATIYKTYGETLKEYFDYLASIDDPNADNNGNLLIAEVYTIDYFYDSKDRASKIYTQRYKTRGELLSGLDTDWSYTLGVTPDGLELAETSTESWERKPNNFWEHRIANYKTAGVVNPAFFSSQEKPEDMSDETFEDNQRSQQLSLVPDNNASLFERSNSGQTVPPAAERSPQKVVPTAESVCGKAIFSLYGGNPYKEKERSYSVEYLGDRKRGIDEDTGEPILEDEEVCDNAQAKAIAQFEGALLAGRFKGQDIGVDIKDELFDWRPLQVVDCIEPDGTIRRYALDDSHWYMGSNRAIANFGAIWLGDVREGSLVKPYAIALQLIGTLRVGGNIETTFYLDGAPRLLDGGVNVGGEVIAKTLLQLGQITVLGGGSVGGYINTVTTVIAPPFNISGGILTGGEILTYLSLSPGEFGVRGGVTIGGNIIARTTLNPGEFGVNGGLSVGGNLEILLVTSQPSLIVRGGVSVGGNIAISFVVTTIGGISIGGNITRIGVGIYWNDLSSEQWNNLNSSQWNNLN